MERSDGQDRSEQRLAASMNEMAWLAVIVVGLAVVGWIATRALERAGRRCPNGSSGLYPECLYRVSITSDEIQVSHPDGTTSRMQLRDLTRVVVETNDSGPWGADVWWHWHGDAQAVCSYPQGATGEDKALAFVRTLNRFEDEQLRSAMGCTTNQRFVIYERAALAGADLRSLQAVFDVAR
jgi:hypothetical protein